MLKFSNKKLFGFFLISLLLNSLSLNASTSNQAIGEYSTKNHINLNTTIMELANKLLSSSRIDHSNMGELAITSFVDLHKFNKTTHFGRTLSESMFDELFVRGFNVTDFRGQNTLSVNANGEYYITRDVNLLKDNINNSYILVGTYSKFEDSILINARILDNKTGRILASARSSFYSTDCSLLENCKEPRKIRIITDGCSTVDCPKVSCTTGICNDQNYNIKRHKKKSYKKIKISKSSTSYKRDVPRTLSKKDHTINFISDCIGEECENTKKCPEYDPNCKINNKLTYVNHKTRLSNDYKLDLIK
ncbi:MAG: FlgO family outer membrane protein [Campylobacterota bacterium]|nr:FlgO family outer membrane protein [Campylobacterota bacterium]